MLQFLKGPEHETLVAELLKSTQKVKKLKIFRFGLRFVDAI
jgi:hypothetical protein